MIRTVFILLFIISLVDWASAQATARRLCFQVAGQSTCQIVGSGNGLPTGAGTTPPAGTTGRAPLVRLCYAVPGQINCQPVDASHPLPVQ